MLLAIQPDDNVLGRGLEKLGETIVKKSPAKAGILALFFAVFVVGVAGVSQLRKEFKLEWFYPVDHYVTDFMEVSDHYFKRGETFNVYMNGVNMLEKQSHMSELSAYLQGQTETFIVGGSINDWWSDFAQGQAPVTDSATFWNNLWQWSQSASGSRHQASIQWADAACNQGDASCSPADGIANARISATLRSFEDGNYRNNVVQTMRRDMKDIFNTSDDTLVFPYSYGFSTGRRTGSSTPSCGETSSSPSVCVS